MGTGGTGEASGYSGNTRVFAPKCFSGDGARGGRGDRIKEEDPN